MQRLPCPYLHSDVELSEERERHIAERHPDLLPEHRVRIAGTLAEPDRVQRSSRFPNARLFSRWYDDLRGGKHVTAYLARSLSQGEIEWQKS